MVITFWGTRGSIPVSGPEYLTYGGDTTCVEIRTKHDYVIVVDAGSGIRRLGNRLVSEQRFEFTIIFTHAHLDHLLGFPFFKPLYFSKSVITLCGCPFTQSTIKEMISHVMTPPYFPVNLDDIRARISYEGECTGSFGIDSVIVTPIFLSHPNRGLGYKFTEDGKSFVFLTDNELTFRHKGGLDYEEYVSFASGADMLVHDAEFTAEEYAHTKGWGHTVYDDAVRLALDAGVKKLGLFHHNQDRDDEGVDRIVEDSRRIIAEHNSSLSCFAVSQNMEITL
jgi:phosphoribosyl 1,2-cyclic phosphodiesterase